MTSLHDAGFWIAGPDWTGQPLIITGAEMTVAGVGYIEALELAAGRERDAREAGGTELIAGCYAAKEIIAPFAIRRRINQTTTRQNPPKPAAVLWGVPSFRVPKFRRPHHFFPRFNTPPQSRHLRSPGAQLHHSIITAFRPTALVGRLGCLTTTITTARAFWRT